MNTTSAALKTHHIFQAYFIGANGQRSEPTEHRLHVSRNCSNCAHDGLKDPEWIADDGIERFSRCMNGCNAADEADTAHQWCGSHQTPQEWDAGVSRIERPVLALVKAAP